MIILKFTKNQGFTFSLEMHFSKSTVEVKLTPPSLFRVNERNLCRKWFHGSQHFLLKFMYAKFFKMWPVKVYLCKIFQNILNFIFLKEKVSFLLVHKKSTKFSNLRKFMSVKCKNVTIWPKNFMFHRNTAYDMQIVRKTVKSYLPHAL